ncbi:unnamed protein product [Linum tenue]|uniref:Uncharacterized protein n=1 Tax=Linum tenue TaxID=586396 RepID=A0AAV0RII1_9ROSI|nr:unnamed protein product [Linum tenue]
MSETTERSGGAGERSDHILLFAGDQSLQRPSEMGISTAGEYTNPRGGDTCLEGSLEGLVTGDEEYVAGPRKEGLPDSMQVSARTGYKSIPHAEDPGRGFQLELLKMDAKSLGEEYESFLSDKAGELEYLQSLEQQIKKLEDVTHTVNCICGSEYRVAMGLCA